MKVFLPLFFLTLFSCQGDDLSKRKVPLYNSEYLDQQTRSNYLIQDAYVKDSQKNKSFFNELFKKDKVKDVQVIDESDTGNLQRLSNQYKEIAKNNDVKSSIVVKPKASSKPNDQGFLPKGVVATNYKLLSKSSPGRYVQVAAFRSYQEAYNMTAKLLKFNNVVINERQSDNGKKWYRVRSGPVATKGLALNLQQELDRAGYKDSIIIIER
jgi:septal ring-binding cell division protein DamX